MSNRSLWGFSALIAFLVLGLAGFATYGERSRIFALLDRDAPRLEDFNCQSSISVLSTRSVSPLQPTSSVSAVPDQALKVSEAGHWFEFRGRRILLLGDSVTQGWMELGENFYQEAYLDALAQRGVNVVLLWSYIGILSQENDDRIGYDAPELWPWVCEDGTFELDHFNAVYFERLRSFVQFANSRNIIVVITIHDGWIKRNFAGHPFNQANGGPLDHQDQYVELASYSEEMPKTFDPDWSREQKHQYYLERFSDYLIEILRDYPNVAYEIFNEGNWHNQEKLWAFQVHFLNFFKARTGQPLLVNDDYVGGESFRQEPVDALSHHNPKWDSETSAKEAFDYYANEFYTTPTLPLFFSEPVPAFQGEFETLDALMRLMWGTALAGSGFVVQNDTSWGFDQRTAMASKREQLVKSLDLQGHASRFFNLTGINFDSMAPNGQICSTGVCLLPVPCTLLPRLIFLA
jgi:hypothetical protein